jgi:multidrug efflux system membrane fusion protein
MAMAVGTAAGSYWYFWAAPTPTLQPQRSPAPTIPVKATVVQRQDVPVFLSGIGTVHAFNVVTVKTRVDGHLDRVAFVEARM